MEWVNFSRSLYTLACFTIFLVILIGAYSKKSKQRYEEAGMLPFMDDEHMPDSPSGQASKGVKQ
ncbi:MULTISPECIES: cbb3-type cytochrome c oxidase subunit 3 [Craterilacuibacter]|uniref:CcoQ/FixQ family Cbb3-type cytochrome c oxidase assembly chaperone n=1 Tax=Craterilacuibacter sinensis TaxID=2686017 RepID=A0A845BNN3_9NEIS|nr:MULTISPECIES: cbb3-type cytochrome c oxidase subunit 3 [Craterilacuibacter]MCL6263789.1 cbb3-type cytochrome c oxidase subunit 3 [Craterilacuibacter sp. RT1T]MCP9759235.1 cbb3-type cytochrome c oxidase subunit 3 [Aquitalea sp. S1-19]MXR38042.1 CcoQ/FixQ family Cbb3-type cytochrome c oxidase assembly chaperone [Craterilacuibacter sinensis]RQW26569.1 cbb3-type cytochrome c oxidase subunit 3 [Rhodobacteraceae bacterium CH30]